MSDCSQVPNLGEEAVILQTSSSSFGSSPKKNDLSTQETLDLFKKFSAIAHSESAQISSTTCTEPLNEMVLPKGNTITSYFKRKCDSSVRSDFLLYTPEHIKKIRRKQSDDVESSPIQSPSEKSTMTSPMSLLQMKETIKKQRSIWTQLHLDVGQRDFGHSVCSICSMPYHKGQDEDEMMHAKYHRAFTESLKFSGWKDEIIVSENFVNGGRIVCVTEHCPSHQRKKALEILHVVNVNLGSSDPTHNGLEKFKAYIYVSSAKQVIGFLLVEAINYAFRIIPDTEQSKAGEKYILHDNSILLYDKLQHPACMGISRIWVASKSRREGIASSMLDAARHHFQFGRSFERTDIAFSQPTSEGRKLAECYTKRMDFLTYF